MARIPSPLKTSPCAARSFFTSSENERSATRRASDADYRQTQQHSLCHLSSPACSRKPFIQPTPLWR